MKQQPKYNKKLFLVGMMGTGKSTVGKLIAKKINLQFLDTDLWIEKKNDSSVENIFQNHGESHFRHLEKNLVECQLPEEPCVVSCGGGLCIADGMMEVLKCKGIVVCLWATPKEIAGRLASNNERPLLKGANLQSKISEILEKRRVKYLSADHVIKTDGLPTNQVAEQVIELLDSSVD